MSKELNEAHFEGLLSFSRQVRNRLIFFLLFAIYALLSVMATTDKMIFLESPIKMPLLNLDLPLIAFYIVIPLFLVGLHFNLLYIFSSYKKFLLHTQVKHPLAIKSLPFGLYEGILFNTTTMHKSLRVVLSLLLYILPLIVLFAFWFRFADYQNFAISSWHLILLVVTTFIALSFRGLMAISSKKSRLKSSLLGLVTLLFLATTTFYHFYIVTEFSSSKADITKLRELEKIEISLDKRLENYFKFRNWLLPRLIVTGELLVPIEKDKLELLKELKNSKNTTLLNLPLVDRSYRNFNMADFTGSILIKTNFYKANLIGACFSVSNLFGSDLRMANFVEADLLGVNLSFSDLRGSNFTGADISLANLIGTSLNVANFMGSQLVKSKLIGADIKATNFIGANLIQSNFIGSDLSATNFMGARLTLANFTGARLTLTNFAGANLIKTNFIGVLSSKDKIFYDVVEKKVDIKGVMHVKLTNENVKAIIYILKNIIKDKKRLKEIEQRLNKAIGIEPIEWIKSQPGINLGILTKEMADKIDKEVTNPQARENMGLKPLKQN